MSTMGLTLQEAVARDRIVERISAANGQHAHHAPGPAVRSRRRHTRAALLLRSLAERLDPAAERPQRADLHVVPAPHAGSPRPWTAAPRRAPHRHS